MTSRSINVLCITQIEKTVFLNRKNTVFLSICVKLQNLVLNSLLSGELHMYKPILIVFILMSPSKTSI